MISFKKSWYVFKNLDFLYICAHATECKKESIQDGGHAFALRVTKNFEKTIDTTWNVSLKIRPFTKSSPDNIKLLMILLKKRKKKDMAKKDSEFQWYLWNCNGIPLLVPGHLRSKHPQIYVQRFWQMQVMTKEI